MDNYPMIDRSNINFFDDPDVHNIGYHEGVLSDGRPYRLECWAMDQITNITVFTSTIDLEKSSRKQVLDYLENEGIFTRLNGEDYGYVTKFEDSKGNEFFSVNLVIADDEEMFFRSDIPLMPFV